MTNEERAELFAALDALSAKRAFAATEPPPKLHASASALHSEVRQAMTSETKTLSMAPGVYAAQQERAMRLIEIVTGLPAESVQYRTDLEAVRARGRGVIADAYISGRWCDLVVGDSARLGNYEISGNYETIVQFLNSKPEPTR